jgi:hypothetical protein
MISDASRVARDSGSPSNRGAGGLLRPGIAERLLDIAGFEMERQDKNISF